MRKASAKAWLNWKKWDILITYYNVVNEIRVTDTNLDLCSLRMYALMEVSSGKRFKLN